VMITYTMNDNLQHDQYHYYEIHHHQYVRLFSVTVRYCLLTWTRCSYNGCGTSSTGYSSVPGASPHPPPSDIRVPYCQNLMSAST
ncbi:hypothetical protein BaRGS_00009519, partial [Batillaria attramentaria]